MQRLIQIITTAILSMTLFIPATLPVFAETQGFGLVNRTSSSSAIGHEVNPTTQETRISDLKNRANQELTRRITSLQEVLTKINGIKKLSASQKATLTSQV